jgi:hypothetical protein
MKGAMVMDKKLKQEVTALLTRMKSQQHKAAKLGAPTPPYPVDLQCEHCGERLRDGFLTVGAKNECVQIWNRWHRREGHARMIPILPRKLRKGEKLAEQSSLFEVTR